MQQGRHRELTSLERRFVEQGVVRGKAESLLCVLETRGIEVSKALRAHVLACNDAERIQRWLVRAVTVERAADAVDD